MEDKIKKTLSELRERFEDIIGEDIMDFIENEILEALEED